MGYIFESEIESIMHAVRARTIGEEESITLAEILASDIHPAIKAYFRAEVQRMLQEERKHEVRSKKFPYALPEVVRLHTQIDLLLTYFYEFNQSEFDSLLDHAVHFQFNYLCRPQWTLLGFVLENQRRVSTNAILRKFDYCIDYVYFKEIIKRHIEERGLAEVTYEEFKELLRKIDQAIVSQHSSLELARLTRPILGFMQAREPHSEKKLAVEDQILPINAAIVFFEDKELNDLKIRLERKRDQEGINDITILQLADIIEKVRTGNEEATVAVAATEPETALPEIPPSTENVFSNQINQASEEPEAVKEKPPGEDDFERIDLSDNESALYSAPGGKNVFVDELQDWREDDRDLSERDDVHMLFSKTEQKMFIKKIFHKDEVEFRNALDALNQIRNWKEASLYLDQIFIANDIDPFSKDAIRFTDKIQSRYGSSAQQSD